MDGALFEEDSMREPEEITWPWSKGNSSNNTRNRTIMERETGHKTVAERMIEQLNINWWPWAMERSSGVVLKEANTDMQSLCFESLLEIAQVFKTVLQSKETISWEMGKEIFVENLPKLLKLNK